MCICGGDNLSKILLVEDDKKIVLFLTEFLQNEGFEIESVGGQSLAIEKVKNNNYDLVLLDISLSEGNGFAVCSAIKQSTNIPVIFLTASGDEYSVVTGLDIGADDYIAKPFRPRELLSRIRNVLRRAEKVQSLINIEDISVDLDKAMVTKKGETLFLTALEYRLFLVLLNNKGIVLSRNKLLQEIWDIAGEFVNDNTLTVYIKRLREKLEDDPQNPKIIKTVRGLGYKVGD